MSPNHNFSLPLNLEANYNTSSNTPDNLESEPEAQDFITKTNQDGSQSSNLIWCRTIRNKKRLRREKRRLKNLRYLKAFLKMTQIFKIWITIGTI